jgi:hypothetical protein
MVLQALQAQEAAEVGLVVQTAVFGTEVMIQEHLKAVAMVPVVVIPAVLIAAVAMVVLALSVSFGQEPHVASHRQTQGIFNA